MYVLKNISHDGPAFRMREKDFFSILEACVFLCIGLKGFKKLRDEYYVSPISRRKPYEFHRNRIEYLLYCLLVEQMMGFDNRLKLNPPSDPDAFFNYHYRVALERYCYVNMFTLRKVFKSAVHYYELMEGIAA